MVGSSVQTKVGIVSLEYSSLLNFLGRQPMETPSSERLLNKAKASYSKPAQVNR